MANNATDAGEQNPQMVENLGCDPHRVASMLTWCLASHSDRGRDSLDPLGGRFVELLQEPPGVRGTTLDIPALAFCVQGVQSQARFAASADTANHRHLTTRDIQVNALEIVDFDTAQHD